MAIKTRPKIPQKTPTTTHQHSVFYSVLLAVKEVGFILALLVLMVVAAQLPSLTNTNPGVSEKVISKTVLRQERNGATRILRTAHNRPLSLPTSPIVSSALYDNSIGHLNILPRHSKDPMLYRELHYNAYK